MMVNTMVKTNFVSQLDQHVKPQQLVVVGFAM